MAAIRYAENHYVIHAKRHASGLVNVTSPMLATPFGVENGNPVLNFLDSRLRLPAMLRIAGGRE